MPRDQDLVGIPVARPWPVTEGYLPDLLPMLPGPALCAEADPEAFFPEKGGSTKEAKQVCRRCDVRAECLDWALENGERWGVWGGLSERERRKLMREAS